MTNQFNPCDLHCVCEGTVETVEFEGSWNAVCSGCHRQAAAESGYELVVKWYGMIQEKECALDVEEALKRLIIHFSGNSGEFSSKDLLSIGGAAGRRALTILDATGLVSSRYEVELDGVPSNVDIAKAMEVKAAGGEVRVFCRSNFKLGEFCDGQV